MLIPFPNPGGSTPDAIPSAIKNYLHNIIDRMSQPLRIRVGGNGMDGCVILPFRYWSISNVEAWYY